MPAMFPEGFPFSSVILTGTLINIKPSIVRFTCLSVEDPCTGFERTDRSGLCALTGVGTTPIPASDDLLFFWRRFNDKDRRRFNSPPVTDSNVVSIIELSLTMNSIELIYTTLVHTSRPVPFMSALSYLNPG